MRILAVSDIHGNWPALAAVAETPHDAVLCLGDIVAYGPQPGACLRWLRASGAHIVQGNHDRALAEGVPPRCRPDFEWLADATAGIARSQLDAEEIEFLRTLPRSRQLTLDGKRIVLLHATPADPLYSYLPPDRERWREATAALDADLLLVGHTHLPFQVRLWNPAGRESRQRRSAQGRRFARGVRNHRGWSAAPGARQLHRRANR